MAVPIPIQAQPLHEAATSDEVRAAFERLTSYELPGFVVRAASLENPSGEHIFDMVRKEASAASGTELEYGPDFTVGKITGEGDVGLHADNQPSDSDKETYHVHQTTEGKARISLANQGPKAGDINVRLDERLRGLAEEGKTDPDHMSAVVHTGEVERGDTVVFRVSGKNPTWHNVESLTPDRASSVAVMLPKPQETPKPHDGIW